MDKICSKFSPLLPALHARVAPDVPDDVPDVSKWTSRQLTDHFRKVAFRECECDLFVSQVRGG
jgi:hypothetical protein